MLQRLCVRDVFAPAPGHVFVALRFPNLKLCALAAVCRHRFNRSTLADVLARGDDPCVYAAAQLADRSASDFALLRQERPEEYERYVTAARSLLSIAPTGLSEDRVSEGVCAEPGLAEVGGARVAAWYRRLIGEVYPELGDYLRDDTLEVMSANLRVPVAGLQHRLSVNFAPTPPLPQLRRWYQEYSKLTGRTKACLQALLEHLTPYYHPEFYRFLQKVPTDQELFIVLFTQDVRTLTGRVRGRLSFSQARGAEYLDLADDAIKLALFNVVEETSKETAACKVVACADDTIPG